MDKMFLGSPQYHAAVNGRVLPDDRPLYLMLNLPTACSYACKKCAVPGPKRRLGPNLTPKEREAVLAVAKAAGMLTLVVIGNGEPTENFATLTAPTLLAAYRLGLTSIVFTTLAGLTAAQVGFYANHNVMLFVSLDSLEPATYRWLTGTGDLEQIKQNIGLLRRAYQKRYAEEVKCDRVRLGLNTTVCAQNKHELAALREFAGADLIYVANPPLRRGCMESEKGWQRLVSPNALTGSGNGRIGDDYAELVQLAQEFSDTGGHTSLYGGVCNYFARGVAVDTDGEIIPCGYAGEVAVGRNVCGMSVADFTAAWQTVRAGFVAVCSDIGRTPACLLRDLLFLRFAGQWRAEE